MIVAKMAIWAEREEVLMQMSFWVFVNVVELSRGKAANCAAVVKLIHHIFFSFGEESYSPVALLTTQQTNRTRRLQLS